jgi:hypothetical protein
LDDKYFAFGSTTEMTVLLHFNEVLALKGMSEEKKKRLLCIHSWRHFFNTFLLSDNVPPVKVAADAVKDTRVRNIMPVPFTRNIF